MTEHTKGFEGRLVVEKIGGGRGYDWDHLRDILYHANHQTFRIPTGTKTDLGSIPRCVAWYAARSGVAALVFALHDRLWRYYAALGHITYREADAILRQALRMTDVPLIQRWIIWTGVRYGALTRPHGRREWWKDLHLIAPWTLYALIFIAPPALVAQIFIWINQANEYIFYAAAKPFSRKRVNHPTLGKKI